MLGLNKEIAEEFYYGDVKILIKLRYKKHDLRRIKEYYEGLVEYKSNPHQKIYDPYFHINNFRVLAKHIFDIISRNRKELFQTDKVMTFIISDHRTAMSMSPRHLEKVLICLNDLFFLGLNTSLHENNEIDKKDRETLLHEIDHVIDYNHKILLSYKKFCSVTKNMGITGLRYRLIISLLYYVRTEAYTKIRENLSNGSINMNLLRNVASVRGLMRELTILGYDKDLRHDEMDDFFKRVYGSNLIHICGMYMAVIIFLYNCYLKSSAISFNVNGHRVSSGNIKKDLDEALKITWPKRRILIYGYDESLLVKTSESIKDMGPMKFIKLYEKSHEAFGLSKRYKVISDKWLMKLINRAKKNDKLR